MSVADPPEIVMPLPRALVHLARRHERDPSAADGDEAARFQERLARLFAREAEAQAAAAVDAPDAPTPDAEVSNRPGVVAPSDELRAVTHRISSQFVDVISQASTELLRGGDADMALARIESALASLGRLASAADDARHTELLDAMHEHVAAYREARSDGRGHARFRDALRAWLPDYATYVGGAMGDKLRRLVEFEADDMPLFRHLESVRGIGPRRLCRLYAAGLFTAEAISEADPADMAAVTGLPRHLAERVVTETRGWRAEQRSQVVLEMKGRLMRFIAVVRGLDAERDPELRRAATDAYEAMRLIVTELEEDHVVG